MVNENEDIIEVFPVLYQLQTQNMLIKLTEEKDSINLR